MAEKLSGATFRQWRPLEFRIQAYDIHESFAPDSHGRTERRLVDTSGQPTLGEDAWLIGLKAYEILRFADDQEPTNRAVEEVINAEEGQLDSILQEFREFVEKGQIQLTRPGTKEPVKEMDWAGGDWVWKVQTLVRLVQQLPGSSRAEQISAFGAFLLVGVFNRLDDAIIAAHLDDAEGATGCLLDAAWLLNEVVSADEIQKTADRELVALDSKRASDRAKKRHTTGPTGEAKKFVYDCWRQWRTAPEQYSSASAFARAMLEKLPDTLTSEVVVTRWVRAWAKGEK